MGEVMRSRALFRALVLAAFCLVISCSHGRNFPKSPQTNSSYSDAIAQLNALETPEGVSEELFNALKAEFESKLKEVWGDLQRRTSRAPNGTSGYVTDLEYDSQTGNLKWSYVNTGDYDSNGEVGVPDITPIALHYLHSSRLPGGWPHPEDKWIDGDKSGEVGIPDITPIALNYLSQVAEYAIVTGESEQFPNKVIGFVSFPEHSTYPVEFEVPLPSGALTYVAVTPIDGLKNAGPLSNWCLLSGNLPPVAVIEADVTAGDVPLTVNFDASGSSDPDGMIVLYEWDYEGTGEWQNGGMLNYQAQYEYSVPGNYQAAVRVTDDGGLSNVAKIAITVAEQGNLPPLAHIEANPAGGDAPIIVTFISDGSEDPDGEIVKYEWDFDGDGIFDLDTELMPYGLYEFEVAGVYESAVRVTDDGGLTDIATIEITINEPQNQPPVAEFWFYFVDPFSIDFDASMSYDPDGDIVKYEWDFDGDGVFEYDSESNPYVSHDYGGAGTFSCELRVTDDGSLTATYYREFTIKEPQLQWLRVTIAESPFYFEMTPAIIGGKPAIAFSDEDTGDFCYAQAQDEFGTTWWIPGIIANDTLMQPPSLFEVGGRPSVVFCGGLDGKLHYSRSTSDDGSSWGAGVFPDPEEGRGYGAKILDSAGYPAILYESYFEDWIYFVRALDETGDSWGTPVAVCQGWDIVSASVDGKPAGVFYDFNEEFYKYLSASSADGSSWNTPVTIPGVLSWYVSLSALPTSPETPAIAFFDMDNDILLYTRALDSDGSTWAEPVQVDTMTSSHDFLALKIVGGLPAILYGGFDEDWSYHLLLKFSQDSLGAVWEPRQYVDSNWGYYDRYDLLDVNGLPGVVYSYPSDVTTLVYAIPQ